MSPKPVPPTATLYGVVANPLTAIPRRLGSIRVRARRALIRVTQNLFVRASKRDERTAKGCRQMYPPIPIQSRAHPRA